MIALAPWATWRPSLMSLLFLMGEAMEPDCGKAGFSQLDAPCRPKLPAGSADRHGAKALGRRAR
jgi:hypothetical protein